MTAAVRGRPWPMDREARELHMAMVWAANRLEDHPKPEVEARLALASEVSRGPSSLRRTAEAAGFAVTVTYARGTLMRADGKSGGRVIDSLALRMKHADGRRAVAVYHDGKAEHGFTWRHHVPEFPRKCNVTEVKAFIVWSDNAGRSGRTECDGMQEGGTVDPIRDSEGAIPGGGPAA
jgi:hypothetical protein